MFVYVNEIWISYQIHNVLTVHFRTTAVIFREFAEINVWNIRKKNTKQTSTGVTLEEHHNIITVTSADTESRTAYYTATWQKHYLLTYLLIMYDKQPTTQWSLLMNDELTSGIARN